MADSIDIIPICTHCKGEIVLCKCGYDFCTGWFHLFTGMHFCSGENTYAEVAEVENDSKPEKT